MSDFLSEVLTGAKALVEKQITINGKTGVVHLRRITAGERHQLLRGQKMMRQGGETKFELDLALNEEQQHKLVQFSVVKPDGKPFFANVEAVRNADSATVHALYKAAASIDKTDEEEQEPGKG